MQKLRILVVDDEVNAREATVSLFKKHNFIVLEASSGEEALEILSRESVDGIILDVFMQYMGGIECLREIRRRFGRIMIFMYTDTTNERVFKEAEQFNANGYFIHKDFSLSEIKIITGLIEVGKGWLSR